MNFGKRGKVYSYLIVTGPKRLFWLACSLALATGLAQATTYYVSTTGNDSNPGTEAAPFLHVSKGAAAAQAGDTVIVMNGTYGNEGQLANLDTVGAVVTMSNSGVAGKPITIEAQTRGGVILNASSTVLSPLGCYGAWSYFDLSYTSYVVIQGFVIENGCVNGIRANGTAHDLTIRWNEIQDIGNWNNPATTLSPSGMYVNSSEYNITFDGNSFSNIGGGTNVNQQHALYLSGYDLTVVNNLFYDQVHGWDIQVAGAKNLTVANNTFAFPNPNRQGHIILWDDDIEDSLQNITIQNNIFYEPLTYAVVTELDAGGSIGGCEIDYNLTTVGSTYDDGSDCTQVDNLVNTNPNMINTSSAPYNFHLQPGSPAIDSGYNNSYTAVDYDDWVRPVNYIYDRGAYEYHTTTTAAAVADYTTGLVAEWKLLGTTVESVAGDNGTLHGGYDWVKGSLEGVALPFLQLTGTTGYMSAPETKALEMTSQMTVAVWVYATSSPSGDSSQRLIAKVYDWDIKLNGTYPQFTAGSDYAMANYSLPLNTWTHIAFTFSAGAVTAYINGQPVALAASTFTSGFSLPADADGLYIGTDSSLTYFYSGCLSDARLYNLALTAQDISELYKAGASAVE
jgi:Concanavalin A-like lectin/glucanases superfamily/Protein of unknown function (DUF1565)